jgi:hypothetical protein
MIKIPEWRLNPEPVLLNCLKVKDLPDQDECIVQFQTRDGHFTSFVPKQHVYPDEKRLKAVIIADVDGGILVDIPAETLTSGPRLLILDGEKESVLTFKNWMVQNGT